MTFYSHRWFADRVGRYGWQVGGIALGKWSYLGKGLPHQVIGVEERWIDGRPILAVEKRWVDLFDECIQEIFGQTIYDGSEEELPEI